MTLLISFFQVSIRLHGRTIDITACTIFSEGPELGCLITESVSPNSDYFVTVIVKNTLFQTEVIKNITTEKAGM